jgi:D-alanyl-D-alanine carboxypeptidase
MPGASEPAGPGTNGAGLGIFRYRTRCGPMYGHTGNFPGYTQLAVCAAMAPRQAPRPLTARSPRLRSGSRCAAPLP